MHDSALELSGERERVALKFALPNTNLDLGGRLNSISCMMVLKPHVF